MLQWVKEGKLKPIVSRACLGRGPKRAQVAPLPGLRFKAKRCSITEAVGRRRRRGSAVRVVDLRLPAPQPEAPRRDGGAAAGPRRLPAGRGILQERLRRHDGPQARLSVPVPPHAPTSRVATGGQDPGPGAPRFPFVVWSLARCSGLRCGQELALVRRVQSEFPAASGPQFSNRWLSSARPDNAEIKQRMSQKYVMIQTSTGLTISFSMSSVSDEVTSAGSWARSACGRCRTLVQPSSECPACRLPLCSLR